MIEILQSEERHRESKMSSSSKDRSKLGRKGDPRMHLAVAARLASPDISLFEALRLGGFHYPTNDDASVVDTEKVTLGQRKNQLSRRLRLARKNPGGKECRDGGSPELSCMNAPGVDNHRDSVASKRNSTGSINSSLSMEAQKELQKLMQHSRTSKMSTSNNMCARALQMKREASELGLSDDEVDPEATGMDLPQQEEPKRQRIAKFHPDFAPLFVPPSASARNSFGNTNTGQKTNAAAAPVFQNQQAPAFVHAPNAVNMPAMNMGASAFGPAHGGPAAGFPQATRFRQQISNVFNAQQAQQPRASAVAISSLSTSAQSMGMTLEQLAMTLASNPTNLAKVLTEGSGGDAIAKQQELALHLYETESKALYSKCMLMAGIDPRICQPNSPAHLQFALKAWQVEGKRLHDLMGRGLGDPPLNFAIDKLPNKSNKEHSSSSGKGSDNHSTKHHDHSHDHGHDHSHDHKDHDKHDEDCGPVRHVHRLDGQCGHKAIIHQPKDGGAHIDFVIGNTVECYHGIEPLGKNFDSVWPSKYNCTDFDESCSNKCGSTKLNESLSRSVPKIIQLKDINLQDPEWNYDVTGSIDGGVMGLFKLGRERSDSNLSSML
jgi:hypothetical protein